MVDHVMLPLPQVLPSRRTARGFGVTPQRNPREHGRELGRQLASFPILPANRGSEGVDPRFVFKIRSSAGVSDEGTLELRELQVLGHNNDATYFVLTNDGGQTFAAALRGYAAGQNTFGGRAELSSLYNKIDSIEFYGVNDRRGPGLDNLPDGGDVFLDVTLWPARDIDEAAYRMSLLEVRLTEIGGNIVASSVLPRFSIARCRIPVGRVDELLDLFVIETARTPPVPYMDPSDWRDVEAALLDIADSPAAAIGVLDDLPSTNHPILDGRLTVSTPAIDIGRAWHGPSQHGTMVAGLALAPDLASDLRAGSTIETYGEVVSIRVLEPDGYSGNTTQFPPEVLTTDLVIESIRKLNADYGVRVFNLSFGYDNDYSASHVGELSEMLDSLIRELDIVVIVAAGNVSIDTRDGTLRTGHHVAYDYPSYLELSEHGLAQPANAALAVVVGGFAASDSPSERNPPRLDRIAVAPVGHISPFSRTGPGHGKLDSRINKPDFVAPAGNVIVNDVGTVDINDHGSGVVAPALSASGGLFQIGHGTSFAAPIVAHAAAVVLDAYPESSANLVRALLASSAMPPLGAQQEPDKNVRHNRYGFGIVSPREAIESREQFVTMMFDGEIAVDTSVIHPVPIPRAFALPSSSTRVIKISLAFDPPVRRTRQEYTCATMTTDAYRNVSLEELQERLVQQDPEDPQPLFHGRRRVTKFVPSHTAHKESTLQMKEWTPVRLDVGDGDTYFVVVTHKSRTWFRDRDDYQSQKYALAVTLIDEAQVTLDLPILVQQTSSVRGQARERLRR